MKERRRRMMMMMIGGEGRDLAQAR